MKRHIFTKKGHIHSLLQFAFLHVFPKLFPLKVFSVQFVMLYVHWEKFRENILSKPQNRIIIFKRRTYFLLLEIIILFWGLDRIFSQNFFQCRTHSNIFVVWVHKVTWLPVHCITTIIRSKRSPVCYLKKLIVTLNY